MFSAFSRLLALAFLASLPAATSGDPGVDQLDQSALQQAFRVLKSGYIRPDVFSYDEVNRAALDGLLRRLQFGAELVPADRKAPEVETPQPHFHAELLNPTTGYVRLQTYGPEELPMLDEWLGKFQSASAKTVILDLRVPQRQSDLDTAARILDRFVNPNTILFKMQKPKEDRPRLYVSQITDIRWKDGLVVLVDSECSSAAELIAAVLRHERGAFLVGSPTRGLTVEYDEVPLTKAVHLRFAVAEVVLADSTSLFRKGIQPHLVAKTELVKKHKIFAASTSSSKAPLTSFLLDRARPRMNEAALVRGTDPELDYYVARTRGERTQYDQLPLQDETLQRALDLLTTLEFVKGGPNTVPAGPPPRG